MANKINKKNKGLGKSPKGSLRKTIQIKYEHIPILKQEAEERFEGNLSMLIRHILDWYIGGRECVPFSDRDLSSFPRED